MMEVCQPKARRLLLALDLIYDRTDADAERWLYLAEKMDAEGFEALTLAERAEWLTDVKGSYNCSDLNTIPGLYPEPRRVCRRLRARG